jgi:hypothetical protein
MQGSGGVRVRAADAAERRGAARDDGDVPSGNKAASYLAAMKRWDETTR